MDLLRHLKIYISILAVLVALLAGIITDSLFRGHDADRLGILKTISPLLPSADPGMNTSARYIRHLGLSTPGSAFPDYPAQQDYLPAGMMWPPPAFGQGLPQKTPCPPEIEGLP